MPALLRPNPQGSYRPTTGWLAWAVLAVAWSAPAQGGTSTVELAIGDLAGTDWRAEGVRVELVLDDTGRPRATVHVPRLLLPGPVGAIEGLRASCPRLEIGRDGLACAALALSATGALAGLPTLAGPFAWTRSTGAFRWAPAADGGEGGSLTLSGASMDEATDLRLEVTDFALARWFDAWWGARAAGGAGGGDAGLDGRLQLELTVSAPADGPFDIAVVGQLDGLTAYNPAGTAATEALDLSLTAELTGGDDLVFDAQLAAAAGEAYLQPVYADLAEFPLELALAGSAGPGAITIERLNVHQAAVGGGEGAITVTRDEVDGWSMATADLTLSELTFPGAYRVLLQPFLADTDLGDLDTLGSARGELRIDDGELDAAFLSLDEVYLDDRAARLAVYGLYGDLAWGPGAGDAPIRLVWDGGYLYGFSYGAADLRFERSGSTVALAEPVAVPILDGALEIDVLELGGANMNEASAAFDARLTPVDMRSVAQALGWPPLTGTLSGEIPRLSYRDGEVTFGGEFRARVFDGTVIVRDFNVRDPFGEGTRLQADVALDELDLGQVTEAFSFGLITGRLDGYVRELRMIDWEPVAFDARLLTSPGNRGRRRISQRAVDNIASLGGGGAAALSSGFLRFFDDFAYEQIELGCRLTLDVCRMSGIAPQGEGYLILQGRGLPRITVVGFAREVSWPTMVAQLRAIAASDGPVLE